MRKQAWLVFRSRQGRHRCGNQGGIEPRTHRTIPCLIPTQMANIPPPISNWYQHIYHLLGHERYIRYVIGMFESGPCAAFVVGYPT